ncbi:pilus assembly protein [Brevibacillus humidisoli]|uniref:TadE/TadG family type IV pilus assembly protein n=1 Tax=Brevibacillus humidisoli TaxID=2895522 RepID=UPI001E634995|nr:TadE family protein [Brevibacillus humidisoli]UFJ40583.1 pilus assembly protein [Brevibacillus humidisoli]
MGVRELSRLLRSERGSQLLEFIFVMPLLWFLFLFAVDQFSLLYNRQKVLAAAYEAGRIACLQPNFGLARYHAEQRGLAELDDTIGAEQAEIRIVPEGRWRKGNHIKAVAILTFKQPASGGEQRIVESYHMMIENAGGFDRD